mmetsp:Transcript_70428/g.114438  ORF Transcript_70428/g.114438 Transcript_70428/m.114438 type:complete len:106 (+) Transcript_70428:886-1203(+)
MAAKWPKKETKYICKKRKKERRKEKNKEVPNEEEDTRVSIPSVHLVGSPNSPQVRGAGGSPVPPPKVGYEGVVCRPKRKAGLKSVDVLSAENRKLLMKCASRVCL